jgi:hypothetical protein
MADGGFLVKFDGKEAFRCYAVAFDYEEWQYIINGTDKKKLPVGIKSITVEIEQG